MFRLLLSALLVGVLSGASAANVTVQCGNTPVEAVIAELARQSGEEIGLAAPTDKTVTARLTDVPVEHALEVVADLCDGVFTKDERGYRVYPKPTPEHVLELMREACSAIKDIEVWTEWVWGLGREEVVSRQKSIWKPPGLYRVERTHSSDGKIVTTLSVCDGESVWRWESDSCVVTRQGVPKEFPRSTLLGPAHLRALAFLPSADPARLPGLQCTSVEKSSGRVLFVVEFGAERPEPSLVPRISGWLHLPVPGMEMAYLFRRPELQLEPTPVELTRIGVDADTGLVVFEETMGQWGVRRAEASDIRDVAPRIRFPFGVVVKYAALEEELQVRSRISADMVRANLSPDEKLFTFEPPSDVFVDDQTLDLRACEERLKERPDDPDLHYTRAHILRRRPGLCAAALAELKRAAGLRPAVRPKLLPRMLEVAVRAGREEDALGFIGELRSADPESKETSLDVAQAYVGLGMETEALEEYGRAAASYTNRSEAPLMEIAGLCEKQGDSARAEHLYLELMRIGDERQCASAARKLAPMYAAQGRPGSLRAPLEAALERYPDSPDLLAEHGIVLLEVGEPDAAMNGFRRVARSESAQAICSAVRELKRRENYAAAREVALPYLETQGKPSKYRILNELADVYTREGLPVSKAVAAYRTFVSGSSAHEARAVRIWFRNTFQRVRNEALAVVRKAWRNNPSDSHLASLLADLAAPRWIGDTLLDTTRASAAVKQLLGVWPDNAALHGILGEICVLGKDYPEAVRAFKKGMALSPFDPYYYAQLAYVYNRAEKHDRALDVARRLIAGDPENPYYYFVLGAVYANAGVYAEAIEQFKKGDDLVQASRYSVQSVNAALDGIIACCTKLGDRRSAEKYMELKIARATTEHERARAMQQIAAFYARNGEMAKAADKLVEIERTCDASAAQSLIQNSRHSVGQEKRKELADALAAVLEGSPGLVHCKVLLAGLYIDAQDTASANGVLQELTAKVWEDASLLRKVGDIIRRKRAFSNLAIKVYARLLALEPARMQHVISLAQVYSTAGLKSRAVALARKILKDCRQSGYRRSDGSEMEPGYNASVAGGIFSRFEMWDEALEAYDLAIQLRPENWEEYETRIANVYERREEFDRAVAVYTRIAEESREKHRRRHALYQLASICERRQQKDLAVRYLRRAMALAESDRDRQNIQRRIDRLMGLPEPTAPAAKPAPAEAGR